MGLGVFRRIWNRCSPCEGGQSLWDILLQLVSDSICPPPGPLRGLRQRGCRGVLVWIVPCCLQRLAYHHFERFTDLL